MNSEEFIIWLEKKSQFPHGVFEKPLIMGVLNVTPDSFYDGGKFFSVEKACEHAFNLIEQGVSIIDIGGESTRPGAEYVPTEVEMSRVLPVIEEIRKYSNISISIDTYKPEVMYAAINAGATIINDIYALRQEGALAMAALLGVPVCLMHMQGEPKNMQLNPHYPNGVVSEVNTFFVERIKACEMAGIKRNRLILDPGFGFGKLLNNNLNLLYHLQSFKELNVPLMLGVSRKHSIGVLLHKEVNERLIGSIAFSIYAATQGIGILRTHDVGETNQALQIIDAIYQAA